MTGTRLHGHYSELQKRRERKMGTRKINKPKRLQCHKCNSEYGGHHYLETKESYEIMVCPRCGRIKRVPVWKGAYK